MKHWKYTCTRPEVEGMKNKRKKEVRLEKKGEKNEKEEKGGKVQSDGEVSHRVNKTGRRKSL